jgi:pimeloyl-ACP methyl ester carboxylesterase
MWLDNLSEGDVMRRVRSVTRRRAIHAAARQAAAELAHPPLGRFVSVGGVGLHYLERGRGVPVVYLHGAGTMAEELFVSPLGDMLAKRYRVIAIDRPGYGHSGREPGHAGPRAQARLLRAAFDRLGIERPILVGHSWGGALAMAHAVDFPGEAAGVLSIAGWHYPAHKAFLKLFSTVAMPLAEAVATASSSPDVARRMAARSIARTFAPNPVPPAFARFPLDLALRVGQLRANSHDLEALNADMLRLQGRYRQLHLPVEIVIGGADRVVEPHRHGRRLAMEVAGARLTDLGGVGHMPHYVMPQSVSDAVDRLAARR